MTPSTPRHSDSPTIKQERAARREAKLAEHRRELARMRRNRRLGIGAAVVGGLAIVGVVAGTIALTPPKYARYTAGSSGAEIAGVETFEHTNGHTVEPVQYEQSPPAGGDHHPTWLNCGIYTEPVPKENAVHSLEHGAVWVSYDRSMSDEDLATLKATLPSSYIVLAPYADDMAAPITLSAWNAQLGVDGVDDARIAEFLEEYWKSERVPEPGAACSGAFDAPGKVQA